MVNYLQMGNQKSKLSDYGYGQRVYSLVIVNTQNLDLLEGKKRLRSSVSTPDGFTIWERVKVFLVWRNYKDVAAL